MRNCFSVALVGAVLFLSVTGSAPAQTPTSAGDQYGTKAKGVAVSQQAPATLVEGERSGLPNTGMSLLGTVIVGGSLVGAGVALRRRERGHNSR